MRTEKSHYLKGGPPMTSPGYLSNAAAMTQAVQAFSQCAQNAQKAMSNLQQSLNEYLGQGQSATYQGDQATAFWNLHSEIQSQMTTANQQISIMSELVNKSYQNYNSGDSQAAQNLQSLAGSASSNSSALTKLTGV